MKILRHIPSCPPSGIWLGEAVMPGGFEEIEILTTLCSLTNKPGKSVKQNKTSSIQFTFLVTYICRKNTADMTFFKAVRQPERRRQPTEN